MAFDLPPRRTLPADVKERMRPDFAEAAESLGRRGRAPLAVAAAVLLIAGGVAAAQFVVQPFIHNARPGHERVVQPSGMDLARCRTALGDQNWQSSEMVEFGLSKVLVGQDGRFCELTRTKAYVASQSFRPTDLREGTVTFRSYGIIAGIPPKDARTLKTGPKPEFRDQDFEAGDGVVTPHFFVVDTRYQNSYFDLVFDDRATPMPDIPEGAVTESQTFESGDPDPWTLVNVIARCTDTSYQNGANAGDLQNWEPLLVSGLDQRAGVLIAHREHDAWATCVFGPGVGTGVHWEHLPAVTKKPEKPVLVTIHGNESALMAVGRIKRSVDTVEVSVDDEQAVTADVVDGYFIATIPVSATQNKIDYSKRLHVVGRDSDNEVVYEGGFE
ncbi:hypothetical protein SK854_02085 [Lentzea sp. BCCO 10_0061]|uniref:Uncharacterized protein n=1 Tax=Lentzea sokolovensis TaxID=3095429 RepID=A0ABU4UPE0_9PSEU|nr:hypothetical protein [Lentzea sp. BCCO 10_0061]MDX8140884.1 hypothetical protein [Lentzea sp. BCCO 10_0061]